jgi:hypothetical protein
MAETHRYLLKLIYCSFFYIQTLQPPSPSLISNYEHWGHQGHLFSVSVFFGPVCDLLLLVQRCKMVIHFLFCSILTACKRLSKTCMKLTSAECTVENCWWWAKRLPETCRVLQQNKIWIISASGWLFKGNHHRTLSRFLLNYLWGRLQIWTMYYRWWHSARLSGYSATATL